MQLQEVESNVADLNLRQGFDLIYDLLRAYGISNASLSRLKSGSYDKAEYENELLWKDRVYYRLVDNGDDLHDAIDEAKHDELITRHRPRFLVVRDEIQILAVDTRTSDTLDTPLVDLSNYSAFFLPWAGIEKTQLESINYADVKAAEKMARLYDEIVAQNRVETAADIHRLNVFFSRLLFCFFAEDTGVFSDGLFTNGIASLTAEDGSDTATISRPTVPQFSILNRSTANMSPTTSPASVTSMASFSQQKHRRRSSRPELGGCYWSAGRSIGQ